jgi:hypothetical protein
MRKEILIFALFGFFVLCLLSSIYAIDTKVKVTTYADHDLNINFIKSSPLELLESFNLKSGTGEVEFIFSTEVSNFDISAFVLDGTEKVVYKKFEDNTAGQSVHLILFPQNISIVKNYEEVEAINLTNEEVINETVINDSTTLPTDNNSVVITKDLTNNQPASTSGITGMATSNEEGSLFSNNLIYFVLGFLILAAIVFFGMMRLSTIQKRKMGLEEDNKHVKTVRVKKLSEKLKEIKENKPDPTMEYHSAIEEAEKKIKDAQKEINKIKNADKIDDLKKRMDKDKEELEKLLGSEED